MLPHIIFILVDSSASVFLLVVADYVHQLEVVSGEEETVEVVGVDGLAVAAGAGGLQQGRHHRPAPLHLVVQVPGGEQ